MRKRTGYTVIEWLIGVVMMFIIGSIIAGSFFGSNGPSSVGVNGYNENRCTGGYLFNIGRDGSSRQVLNESGGGVKCFN